MVFSLLTLSQINLMEYIFHYWNELQVPRGLGLWCLMPL
jgi:hypothetical protein